MNEVVNPWDKPEIKTILQIFNCKIASVESTAQIQMNTGGIVANDRADQTV
jgi:hypothetical protein